MKNSLEKLIDAFLKLKIFFSKPHVSTRVCEGMSKVNVVIRCKKNNFHIIFEYLEYSIFRAGISPLSLTGYFNTKFSLFGRIF